MTSRLSYLSGKNFTTTIVNTELDKIREIAKAHGLRVRINAKEGEPYSEDAEGPLYVPQGYSYIEFLYSKNKDLSKFWAAYALVKSR